MALGKRVVVAGKGKAPSKDNHQLITVKGKDFAKDLKRFNQLKSEISNLTSEQKSIEGLIKSTILDQYIELYKTLKRNPATVNIASEAGDKVMFIIMKKYVGEVDEDRATDLRKKYGKDFVTEKTEMIMDNDLLNKYSKQLEKLIMSATFLSADEKENLFVEKVTYSIKSDAIDAGFTSAKGKVRELIDDINPVLMLKAVTPDKPEAKAEPEPVAREAVPAKATSRKLAASVKATN